MNIYERYSDKAIRNKPDQDDLERAYTEMQAKQAADRIITLYRSEPRFLMEVTAKLIDGIQAPKRSTDYPNDEI
jgi:hypothetical protein